MPSTIRDLTELTAMAVDDYLLISDTSDVTNRDKRISQANLLSNAAKKTGTPVLNRVASWLDANTVQDAGFLTADIARLSQANTFAGLATLVGGARSGGYSIANAGFIQFTPPIQAGLIIIWTDNNVSAIGIGNYRKSTYMGTLVAGANLTFTNVPLNGTTGTAGKATVSISGTDLYFENQLGGTRFINYLLLG